MLFGTSWKDGAATNCKKGTHHWWFFSSVVKNWILLKAFELGKELYNCIVMNKCLLSSLIGGDQDNYTPVNIPMHLFVLFLIRWDNVLNFCLWRVLAAAAKRSGEDIEGKLLWFYDIYICNDGFNWLPEICDSFSGEKADSLSDGAKRARSMPDLCVICLEQEYNAVFVP